MLMQVFNTDTQLNRQKKAKTDLHPGIKGVHECKRVALVAVEGLASSGAVRVVLSTAQKWRLDTQRSGNRQHRLHQFENRAQNQHFPCKHK